jgi:F420H(2)-dependent quinone reductase
MAPTAPKQLPPLVRITNRIVVPLLRLGVPIGPMYLLTVTGRQSGLPRTTPVATFEFEGKRYLMQAIPRASWVANARAAGWGILGRGFRRPRVTLVEVPVEERGVMLRHAGSIAPAVLRRQFLETGLIESLEAESFAAAAQWIALFRVDEDSKSVIR